ncbi:hypothetical protein [Caballeronia sp. Lep1P3]|uniref:hypothetical protein n=1 Tax=Caballeronia sp. Lep1P3 TaxID=2878150 RepID=UPI001FD56C79|nr:hypothetical protein [Caballeronia sp. Lep1P3]
MIAACDAVLCLCGFALTVASSFPGIMTPDTTDVIHQAVTGQWSDWHAPFYTFILSLLYPSRLGPVGMLLLNNLILWVATFLLADAASKRYGWLGVLFCFIPLCPAIIYMPGFIWDVSLHVALWAFAAALVFRDVAAGRKASTPTCVAAIALVVCGVLVRQNGWFAAALLVLAALPATMRLRTRLFIVVATFVAMPLIWTGFAKITQTVSSHAVNSILIHDLGAMSAELRRNVYPGDWSSAQADQIEHNCMPDSLDARAPDNGWDVFAWGRCGFVLKTLSAQHLMDTHVLAKAWLTTVVHHPVAYAKARIKFFATFLHAQSSTPLLTNSPSNDGSGWPIENHALIGRMYAYASSFLGWGVFRPGTWLVCNLVAFFGLAWLTRHADASPGRRDNAALGMLLAGGSIVWVATYAVFGVAFDFRYVFWNVYIGLLCLLIAIGEATMSRVRRDAADAGRDVAPHLSGR